MAMIKCPECGSEISNQAILCPKCGFPIKNNIAELSDAKNLRSISNSPKPACHKIRWSLVLGTVFIIILVFAVVAIFINGQKNTNSILGNIIPQEHQTSLVNGSIIVRSNQWLCYNFNTQQNWRNIHIKGSFNASGGSGNDIRVLIMTQNDFTNYTNRHKYSYYYDSGKLTVSNLDVQLSSNNEEYVLVFDNTFSLVTDKNVNANINFICTY